MVAWSGVDLLRVLLLLADNDNDDDDGGGGDERSMFPCVCKEATDVELEVDSEEDREFDEPFVQRVESKLLPVRVDDDGVVSLIGL